MTDLKSAAKTFLVFSAVFLIFFGLFFRIQFSFPNFSDPDAYYHIKHAWLIRNEGVSETVKNFPWLQCSTFKEHPGDLWFGYHLLLLPFTFGDLIFGGKLSAVFFSSFLFLGFFWLLRRLKVKYPLFWLALLFLAADTFLARLSFTRPIVLAVLLSLLGFYFLFRKNHWGIFILSLIYSFSTTEAPLIIFIAAVLCVLERLKTKKFDLRPLALAIFGILLGFIIRPDFPHNLYLVFRQMFTILFLKFSGVRLDFGVELLFPWQGGIRDNIFLFLAFALPLIWLAMKLVEKKWREIPLLHLSLFCLSFFFAGLTFSSHRFIEYWTPFTALLAAVWASHFFLPGLSKTAQGIKALKGYDLFSPYEKFSRFYQRAYGLLRRLVLIFENKFIRQIALGLGIFLIVCLVLYKTAASSIDMVLGAVGTDRFTFQAYREAGAWLEKNTGPGSVVLNFPWDTFPALFFFNHRNYYCYGMDPAVMYIKNPQGYWAWRNLVDKSIFCEQEKCDKEKQKLKPEQSAEIAAYLKKQLNGDYIFLGYGPRHQEFTSFLNSSPKFEKVFKRGNIEIYRIN